jgi:hypothetical protein
MKKNKPYSIILVSFIASAMILWSCKKDETGSTKYSVGGTVQGLAGSGLVLQNNGTDDLSISEDGPFTFHQKLEDSADYYVTVKNHPSGQACYVVNGIGTIDGENVTDVEVYCRSVTGTVTCTEGSVVYNHNVSTDYEGFHQAISVSGTIPFVCDDEGNITGSGTATITISGTITAPCTESSFSGTAIMNVTLDGKQTGLDVIINTHELWYVGSPVVSGTITNTCQDEVNPFNYPLFETLIENILPFQYSDGYVIQQPYLGEGGSGYYSWTLYIE